LVLFDVVIGLAKTLQAAGVLTQIERATKKRQGIKVLNKTFSKPISTLFVQH
jgi:hypothetical protein